MLFVESEGLDDETDLTDLGPDSVRLNTLFDRWCKTGARTAFADLAAADVPAIAVESVMRADRGRPGDHVAWLIGQTGPWREPGHPRSAELRREWVVGARPYPPDADIVAWIEADPLLREQFVPARDKPWRRSIRARVGDAVRR